MHLLDQTRGAGSVLEEGVAVAFARHAEDFIFGLYNPDGTAEPGFYSFLTQLQIFDATADRLMLAAPTFSGQWQVRSVPEPATFALLALSLAGLRALSACPATPANRRG